MRKNCVFVDVEANYLYFFKKGCVKFYPISTGIKGTGEKKDSGKTPRGWFVVSEKIGEDMPLDTIFVSRIAQSEKYGHMNNEDPILSRIIWISGIQNNNCNTKSRYIYLHGCKDLDSLGVAPLSKGCVRLSPKDIKELFIRVDKGSLVYIQDNKNLLIEQNLLRWSSPTIENK